eukprot:scaffold176005_cov42-Prasinocladus_malaysianus.AAC.1
MTALPHMESPDHTKILTLTVCCLALFRQVPSQAGRARDADIDRLCASSASRPRFETGGFGWLTVANASMVAMPSVCRKRERRQKIRVRQLADGRNWQLDDPATTQQY